MPDGMLGFGEAQLLSPNPSTESLSHAPLQFGGRKQKEHAMQARGSKPNIILIVGDDVGWGDLGVYGGGEGRGIPTERSLFRADYLGPIRAVRTHSRHARETRSEHPPSNG